MTKETPEKQPETINVQKTTLLPEPVEGQGHPGHDNHPLYLAKWSTRFWAWLIDYILIILFLNIVHDMVNWIWPIDFYWDFRSWDFVQLRFWLEFGFWSLFFFLYWTVLEGYRGRGQSIGKMVMNLKVVNRDGTKINYGTAALESIGKAFLLPLDCLIGWLAMPNSKLRVFNRISNTIVIKTDYREPDGIVYIKEKE